MSQPLDRWVSAEIRSQIENRFYAKVNQQAAFEQLRQNPGFMATLRDHVGLFSDHGVVHVRDVAQQVLYVLEASQGILMPHRAPLQFARQCGYGVLIGYFHDIGMVDFSAVGRTMHPEFAAQAVFDPTLDALIEQIWNENSGNLAWHLSALARQSALIAKPQVILREMLALSMAHSKSKVPVTMLNDLATLRDTLQQAVQTNLTLLYLQQRLAKAKQQMTVGETNRHEEQKKNLAAAEADLANYAGPCKNPHVDRFYADFWQDSFAWMVADHPALQELVHDVVDTIRALRSADALRQRGTYLKTSGNYEVFVDRRTGNAVFALRHQNDKLFLLEIPEKISAGEANIAASELDAAGDLRINFHRGTFTAPEAINYAAECAALVVYDIQSDVIESFIRPPGDGGQLGLKTAESVRILLEETEDNPEFVQLVSHYLSQLDPGLNGRIGIVPSLQACEASERARYLNGQIVDWSQLQRRELLQRMQASGHRAEMIDVQRGFEHVKLIRLEAGDILIHEGTPSTFVYVPLGEGLVIMPLGGYRAFDVQPWMPLGVTGVIQGAVRNATIVAEADLRLLMIPKNVYLQYWHQTHTPDSFRLAVNTLLSSKAVAHDQLTQLEKKLFLEDVPIFAALEQNELLAVAEAAREVNVSAGESVFEEGSVGDALYIVISGTLEAHNAEVTLGQLKDQDVFGELALLTQARRMATAITPSHLLSIGQDAFKKVLEGRILSSKMLPKAYSSLKRKSCKNNPFVFMPLNWLPNAMNHCHD